MITSSPKLFLHNFDLSLKSNPVKSQFVHSPEFKESQHSWFGNKSPDDRLKKLLPNHYLDIQNRTIHRLPVFQELDRVPLSEKEIIDQSSTLLTGTYRALSNRNYKLIQPLTAGWDSRVLLAASKSIPKTIDYYVFNRENKNPEKYQDVRIPAKLADKLNLNFEIIQPEELSQDFIQHYKKNHIYPRILSKTENIQSHFTRYSGAQQKVINLNGNAAEILRCFYGNYRSTPSLNMLLYFSGFPNSEFIKQELSDWYQDATVYSKKTEMNLLDLFYWEQRMGNWGSQFPSEQDIAIEEISPFNNRLLIQTLYATGFKKRKKPNHPVFKKLIQNLWEEVLSEPFNPDESHIKSALKRNALVYYFVLKLTKP